MPYESPEELVLGGRHELSEMCASTEQTQNAKTVKQFRNHQT